jgi:hypothetical protein
MFSNFKSRLRKWAELTHEDFFKLIGWSPSKLNFENRTMVASVSRDGEMLAYLTVQPVYVVGSFALKPETTPSDLQKCGDAIDSALEAEAQRVGIDKFWIELPEGAPIQPDEKTIRVVEKSIPRIVDTNKQLLNDWPKPEAVQSVWVN